MYIYLQLCGRNFLVYYVLFVMYTYIKIMYCVLCVMYIKNESEKFKKIIELSINKK